MLNNVMKYREARNLSREELARYADSSERFIRALEECESTASVDVALKIAKALGMTVEELFDVATRDTDATESLEKTELDESVRFFASPALRETDADDCAPPKVARRGKTSGLETANEPRRVAAYSPGARIDEFLGEDDRSLFLIPDCVDPNVDSSRKYRRVSAPLKGQTISSYYSRTAEREGLADSPSDLIDPTANRPIRYFDLFCGIGGFRYAANDVLARMGREGLCALSCDSDPDARLSYSANFGDVPFGNVENLPSDQIPDFDLLFAGFPCQTFSKMGLRRGFADETKGTLFFQIARILRDKRPRAFVLENVRQLTTSDNGRAFEIILRVLQDELGYCVDWRVLNALDFGLPQKRERVVVVGSTEPFEMEWPKKTSLKKTLADILEPESAVPKKYYASPEIVSRRKSAHHSKYYPSVWHENKSGCVTSYPYSCALRATASYNYLLVNGERRFTPLELLRLQGFPDDFKIVVSYSQLRKQAGNAAPVNLIRSALERFLPLVFQSNRKAARRA